MTDGLVTRIGKWIDHKWQSKATEAEVLAVVASLESKMIMHRSEIWDKIIMNIGQVHERAERIEARIKGIEESVMVTPKEFTELRERLGHLEVYVGMKRVVDPAKPAVAKSAFAM